MPSTPALAALVAVTPTIPDTSFNPTVFIVLMVAGFFVAVAGHITRFRPVVAVGIACVTIGAALLVVVSLILAPSPS